MSRDDGLATADMDVAMMSDPKVVALARRLRDPLRTMGALGLYVATLHASWKAGRRLTLDESVPGWWLDLDLASELAEHIVAVGLLDDEQRVPEHAFEGWFGPAWQRHRLAVRKAIFAGLRSSGLDVKEANVEADKRIAERAPERGSAPSQPPVDLERSASNVDLFRPSIRPSIRLPVPDRPGVDLISRNGDGTTSPEPLDAIVARLGDSLPWGGPGDQPKPDDDDPLGLGT